MIDSILDAVFSTALPLVELVASNMSIELVCGGLVGFIGFVAWYTSVVCPRQYCS